MQAQIGNINVESLYIGRTDNELDYVKLQRVIEEMMRPDIDSMGISETLWTRSDKYAIPFEDEAEATDHCHSGHNYHQESGVAITLSPNVVDEA